MTPGFYARGARYEDIMLGPAYTSLIEIIYKVNSTELLIKIESPRGTLSSWKLS